MVDASEQMVFGGCIVLIKRLRYRFVYIVYLSVLLAERCECYMAINYSQFQSRSLYGL